MRAFLAIQLPETVKAGLIAFQSRIESGAPGFFRWTPATQMHLTLYFLGDMEDSAIEGLVAVLGQGVGGVRGADGAAPSPTGWQSFELNVGGMMLLPEVQIPRIIAANVGGDVALLRKFQQRLADTVFQIAAFKETRGFSPHITVGRLRQGMPGTAKALKRTLAEAALADSPQFVVNEYELVSSTLSKQGPTYETVHRFALS